MTRVDIISGFLGAGKTTLIKKLLQDALAGTRVVLIENEFGEIGIDGGFLKESGIEIREMNSGCICCSLVGDFATSLKEVMAQYAPDRIIIEPSGVGKLSEVMQAVRGAAEGTDMQLGSAVTVVDASKAKMYIKNFGEFFTDQIASAATVVLTRVDKCSAEKVRETADLVRGLNGRATIVTTALSELDGKQLLSAMENKDSLQDELLEEFMAERAEEDDDHHDHEHHHHHHDDDDDEDEHEHHHHHHHDDDDDDEDEHEHHHHHHHDDDDDDEDEHEHHHHDDDDEDEHDHHHHHDDDHDHDHIEAETDEKGNRFYSSSEHEHHHHHHHHGHDADEVFQSLGIETPSVYSADEVESCLKALDDEETYGTVLRAKGMLPSGDGSWIHFDYVPEETELRKGPAEVTGKICVIGAGLKEDALKKLFVK